MRVLLEILVIIVGRVLLEDLRYFIFSLMVYFCFFISLHILAKGLGGMKSNKDTWTNFIRTVLEQEKAAL